MHVHACIYLHVKLKIHDFTNIIIVIIMLVYKTLFIYKIVYLCKYCF